MNYMHVCIAHAWDSRHVCICVCMSICTHACIIMGTHIHESICMHIYISVAGWIFRVNSEIILSFSIV